MNVNPYAPPAADGARAKRGPRAALAGTPRPWTTREVLELAWQRARTQKSVLMGAALCAFGLPQLVTYAPRVFFEVGPRGVPRDQATAYFVALAVAQLVALFLSSYFIAGSSRMWLDVARGKEARFGDLFSGGARTASTFGVSWLMGMAVAAGFVLLVLPGFVLIAGFSVATYFVVDAEMGPIRALSSSWEVTKGHRLSLLGLWAISVLIVALGSLACGVGVLLAVPIVQVAFAIVYLRMSGRGKKRKKKAAVDDAADSDREAEVATA